MSTTLAYILYTELYGPGEITYLIPPAILLLTALITALSIDPEKPRSFLGLEEKISSKVEEAGLYTEPLRVGYRAVYHIQTMITTIILYAMGLASTFMIFGWSPGPLAVLFAMPLALPPTIGIYVGLYDKAKERLQKTSKELPFFATLASILSRAGLTLYTAFLKALEMSDVMPQIAREAGRVKRDVSLGLGVTDSLVRLAEKHPLRDFKMMILGAVTVWRSGGDLAVTLEGYAKSLLKSLEDSWERYSRTISTLGEALTIIFLILPLGVGVVSIAFAGLSYQLMLYMTATVVPALAIIVYGAIRSADPVIPDRLPPSNGVILGLFLAVIPPLITQTLTFIPQTASLLTGISNITSISTALGVLSAGIIIYQSMRPAILEVEEAEQALPRLVRDITEFRKLGYTIQQSIERCLQNPYPPKFKQFLQRVYGRTRMAVSLREAAGDHRSWLVRTVFGLLQEVEESGGGNPELFEKIEDLLRTHLEAKKRARGAVKLYMYMAMGIPFIVAFSAALILNIAYLIAPMTQIPVSGMPLTLARPQDIAMGLDMAMLLTLEGAVVTALAAGRAVDHHPYGTWRISIAAVSFIIAILTLPYMQAMTGQMFGITSGGGK